VSLDGHRFHCHVAAREVEAAGGDTAAASRRMAELVSTGAAAV
jgi:hypothetical protein